MSRISLTLCGRPAVRIGAAGDSEVPVPAKSLALLAFLALEPGPHSRAELTTLLWGEVPEARAGASLRQALTQLRAALDGELQIERSAVALDGEVECDVCRFNDLVARDPEAALTVDIPHFLAGLQLRHCPGFDEWLDHTRAGLVARYCRALAAVAHAALARRDWSVAERRAEEWLRIDPAADEAAKVQVEARYLAGDEAGAIRAFDEFRARLRTDQDRDPGLGLVELVERIRGGRPRVGPPRQTEGPEAAVRFDAALVGREAHWAALQQAWGEATTGAGRIVVVEGRSGTGKSRLVDDFSRWVRSVGGTVAQATAYEDGASVPFGAMLELIRTVLDAPGAAGTDPVSLGELSRILPEVRRRFPAAPDPAPAPTNQLLFEAASELLRAAAEEHPLLVVVDDLHWCDGDSCGLIRHLIRRLESAPVLWCATITPGDLDRDAPSARLARALRAAPGARRLELDALDREQVWAVIRDLGRPAAADPARRLAARIHEVTEGNPFYLIELLKMLFANGWLTADADSGAWRIPEHAGAEFDVVASIPSVHEAIAERVARLPDELHAILMSVAVAGNGCSTAVLSHVHGISRLRAAVIGDALVERHLAVEQGGRYRCAHPVIARAVRDDMTGARRREVHRALAHALVSSGAAGDEPADPGEVARHAEQGGDLRLGYDHALEASRRSRERAAHQEALAWLDLAAACAQLPEQVATVDRATAALLEAADPAGA